MRTVEEKYGDNGSYSPKRYEFDLRGAWRMQITAENKFSCGDATGFSIGVEVSPHFLSRKYKKRGFKFFGGVLSTSEAKLLAENILKQIK